MTGVDVRGIHRVVWGEWQDPVNPMLADTAQRQAGIDALGTGVDWILQIDNDEVLPDVEALLRAIDEAESRSIPAVEWPMRILFRRTGPGSFLEVCSEDGDPRYDYPGPVAVRAGSRTVDARRCQGAFLRPVVRGDDRSLQLKHPSTDQEIRAEILEPEQAIIHNSWGRTPGEIRRKIGSWGHAAGFKSQVFYWLRWWPAPLMWRVMRDFHPFARGLWPRLRRSDDVRGLLIESDR
ncbi:hypothetical protein [Raineyella fluvialis]|uniref:Glycosyl transferase family 2 n=1 Tax=Raineyella fluvialis TaxID=2662261 RepID=A0A5Q2FAR3_9ACTN|nr:hypothetical protein [Raineyella fluvialis]QGF23889.1 hypothetical protein Rai3103_09595 [Raineyella fluvialis]